MVELYCEVTIGCDPQVERAGIAPQLGAFAAYAVVRRRWLEAPDRYRISLVPV
jgi:hypothetical protein